MKSLTEKYRPHTFESVLGQKDVIAWLTRQVRAGTGRSVILHGPPGVGKTSLGRIYAQALLCENVGETGSPCRACGECRAFEQPGGHPSYIELNCARSGRLEQVEGDLKALGHSPMYGSRWILALDEAHQTSPKAFDAMLKLLEEPPYGAVFIMLTTAIDKVPQTIKSRCAVHELKPVDFKPSLLHLERLCKAEKIAYETDGLALIVDVSGGGIRDMVTRLDQVSEDGASVTEREVRRLFNLDYVDTLVRYMRAVLTADLQAQINVIQEWSDMPAKKAEGVQRSLEFLFMTEFMRLRREDRIMNSMLPADREWIATEMHVRARAAGIDERTFWQEMVDFWNANNGGMTDAELFAKVTKFDAFMNIERAAPIDESPHCARASISVTNDGRIPAPRRRVAAACDAEASFKAPVAVRQSAHLTKPQVRKLWDAGSFLVQEYGILLNTRIVIAHERLGIAKTSDAVDLVGDLVHELGLTLKRWAPRSCSHFHWLYVHEHVQKRGPMTTLVAYVPEELGDGAEEWLFDSFLANRIGNPLPKSAVQMRITRYENNVWRVRRHVQLMRMLCRSVDPNIKVRDGGERRALIDALSIAERLRERFAALEASQRRRVSETIGEQEQRTAKDNRLAPLSAFGDKAWPALFTGWELMEHRDRQREKEERGRAEMKIRLEWPEGDKRQNQVRKTALARLRASWPQDPQRRRDRSWKGWWL